ncbi:hypothetical protein BH11BAC6_BH11BAC6_10950 [soil metagenome]
MIKTFRILPFIACFTITAFSQTDLIIPAGTNLLQDSIASKNLVNSLSLFLNSIAIDNTANQYIPAQDKVQTLDLIDEIKDIQKSGKYKNDKFYKPYLTNVVQINDSTYFLQFSFIGTVYSSAFLRASFDLMAKKVHTNDFVFYSPISTNTKNWKTKKTGTTTFHYNNNLNIAKATSFSNYVLLFDHKLGNINQHIDYYCCNNATEALRILGVPYKADYNGQNTISLNSTFENTSVFVTSEGGENFNDFDPHDLWHSRLHTAIPVSLINKPVDEGCAYLYGGSWGLSWKEIYKMFTERVSKNRQTDWLDLYEKFYNFGDGQEKHLIVGYVINALIVKELEKEKGFSAVVTFLKCGKYEKGNENYFSVLNKLLGINKANFNAAVWKLIDMEKI